MMKIKFKKRKSMKISTGMIKGKEKRERVNERKWERQKNKSEK